MGVSCLLTLTTFQFYLYPILSGNFKTLYGLTTTPIDLPTSAKAFIDTIIFSFLATMLLISIVRTIRTNPGNIPEDKEWDMQTDSMAESNPSSSEDDNGEVGFSSDNSKRSEAPKAPTQGIE